MKKSILSFSVFSLVLLSFVLQSCKKQPRCPKDPCKNPVTVMALEESYYSWGHFRLTNSDNSDVYLYANNWNEYASKVSPGKQYKIGYREVPCVNREGCGDVNGIREGGCVIYPNKCINILCLEEIKGACFETAINPLDFADVNSSATGSAAIYGNSLKVIVNYSGCSPADALKFRLYAQQLPDMSPAGSIVWDVKAVDVSKDITCKALFSKEICFDLSAIKNVYRNLNMNGQKSVIIRLLINNEFKELTYTF